MCQGPGRSVEGACPSSRSYRLGNESPPVTPGPSGLLRTGQCKGETGGTGVESYSSMTPGDLLLPFHRTLVETV